MNLDFWFLLVALICFGVDFLRDLGVNIGGPRLTALGLALWVATSLTP